MKVHTKKTTDHEFDVYANGVKVATIRQRRDFVKARETDRIRTKQVWLHDVTWDGDGLRQLFGDDITVGRNGTVRNMYSVRGKTGTADVKAALAGLTPVTKPEQPEELEAVDSPVSLDEIPSELEFAFDWSYVEREGQDVRFDMASWSLWLRAREDGGWDTDGRVVPRIATWLRDSGFTQGPAGHYFIEA